MLQQAYDFKDECDALYEVLLPLEESDYNKVTQFKGWTINDVLAHLHYFNYLAFHSLENEERFVHEYGAMRKSREAGETIREATDRLINYSKGKKLLSEWREFYQDMTKPFASADPKKRVKWGGPDMSVRSSISARLMETWSHSQAVYDVLGLKRANTDRIKNVAVMGVNTFGWTFINRKEDVPAERPFVQLTAPSGKIWEWNTSDVASRVVGNAEEFCQVVTQTRSIEDTSLRVEGAAATLWMKHAQCFAGVPRTPPAKGARFIAPVS